MCLLVMQGTRIFEFGLTKHKLLTFWSMNLDVLVFHYSGCYFFMIAWPYVLDPSSLHSPRLTYNILKVLEPYLLYLCQY